MISQPTLLLDQKRVENNVARLVNKARKHGLRLRPHMKTHQSLAVGQWLKSFDIHQITVSSVQMADYFAPYWQDITIAFPLNWREIELVKALQNRTKLAITVESPETVQLLDKELETPIDAWVKIDSGYHRTGIPHDDIARLDAQIEAFKSASKIHLKGFLTHAGNTYQAATPDEVRALFKLSNQAMTNVKHRYESQFPDLEVSVGDTPSCSLASIFPGVDEIRPGNFFFYDATQQHLGACQWEDVAVCMACPVVAVHPQRKAIVVYGGGVHFSKEFIEHDGQRIYGFAAQLTNEGWQDPDGEVLLTALSQEHGTLTYQGDEPPYKVGDIAGIVPIHSCMTANLMQGYRLTSGEHIDHLSGSKTK
jgi:D-serine deaminase-like pyridoxal phosphate-dependent protein